MKKPKKNKKAVAKNRSKKVARVKKSRAFTKGQLDAKLKDRKDLIKDKAREVFAQTDKNVVMGREKSGQLKVVRVLKKVKDKLFNNNGDR